MKKPKIFLIAYLFFILAVVFAACPVRAEDDPFIGPANFGQTGLVETPTARILREGSLRVGFATAKPYNYYYGVVSPIKGLEVSGRITEIMDLPDLTPEYGNYKDKSIAIKWQFLPEGKWWPALALGIMDPLGTRLYPSQYIVASKQFYPLDISVGFGNGRYGREPLPPAGESFKMEIFTDNSSWRRDGQFFGGIQYAVTDWLMIMAEYSPIQYEKQSGDPARNKYFTTAVPSNLNFGIRFKPWNWLEADLSWQRGDQIGLNISMDVNFSEPFVPIYDHPYREPKERSLRQLENRIANALHESGFSNIAVRKYNEELCIEATNNKYYYNMKAAGVALAAINQILIKNTAVDFLILRLTLTENGIPVLAFVTNVANLRDFYDGEMKTNEFFYLSKIETSSLKTIDDQKQYQRYWDYAIKPDFKLFLNDPSGFLTFRLGLSGELLFTPWKGGTFAAGLLGYPINTVSSSNTPTSTPVRTDIVAYQQQKLEMGALLFNQIYKFNYDIFGRIAMGYLEEQYAGVDWDVAKPVMDGRFFIGLSGSVVKKREPNNLFGLKENDWKDQYLTGFFNLRLNIPEMEVIIDLKNGQFLAGDRGSVITISRNFNGIILSAWYSITDTSIFQDNVNIGYHDKGIALSIPLRAFLGKDSRTSYRTSISPWTRDVAQDIVHFSNLFDFIGRNVKVYTDKDKEIIH